MTHPPVLDYAQPPRPKKPETRRHGDVVEIAFPPIPPVMRRVIDPLILQQDRRLIIRGDVMQYPGGTVHTTRVAYTAQQSAEFPGALELVAWPPTTPEGRAYRRRRPPLFDGDSLFPEEEPFVLLYGTLQDDFDWTARVLRRITLREARRAAGGGT